MPFCALATRLVWTGNSHNYLHNSSGCTRQNQNRGTTSVSWRVIGKLKGFPTNKVSAWEMRTIYFCFICLELAVKDPVAIEQLHWRRSAAHNETNRRCISQTLYEAKSITCYVTSTTFKAVPAPCAVVLDVSLPILWQCNSSRLSLSSSSVPFLDCKLPEMSVYFLCQ